jgi:hypothetical protein
MFLPKTNPQMRDELNVFEFFWFNSLTSLLNQVEYIPRGGGGIGRRTGLKIV